MEDQTVAVHFSTCEIKFSFSQSHPIRSRAQRASYSMGIVRVFPGGKVAEA